MIQLTDAQAALLRKLLGKLTERSTIAALLTSTLGAMGIGSAELWVQIAGWIGIAASVLLALINDQALAALFKGQVPAPSADVMEPVPTAIPAPTDGPTTAAPSVITKDQPMSLLSSIAGALLHVNPVVSAAVQAVTLVEALFPDSAGAAKLQAAQAYVAKAADTAEDVTSTIEGVLAALKAQGVITSSTVQAAVA